MRQSQQVWWLNPAWVAGLMGLLVSCSAYITPEAIYLAQWKTPKYFDGNFFALSIAFTVLFSFGAIASLLLAKPAVISKYAPNPKPVDWRSEFPWELIHWTFWFCVFFSVAGYLIWGAAAISRGVSGALVMGVLRGEKGAVSQMKDVYLITISGVTTLTQLGIPAMLLGVMIGAAKGWKRVLPPMILLLVLSVVRAMFNAERLAIIELAIPALVLILRLIVFESPRFQSARVKTILQLVPIGAFALLLGVFGLFEYFRSWSSYYAGGDQSFWQFVVLRLTGYYVTALNNGALMAARFDPIGAPFSVLHFLWRFPVTGGLMNLAYPNIKLDNVRLDPYMELLDREANPEFNNSSALLPPLVDFGVPGALVFWLLAGLLCGLLYRWFLDGKVAGLLFYPVFFTGITELTRIMYWGEGRAITAFLILLPLAWMCSVWARRLNHFSRRTIWQPSR